MPAGLGRRTGTVGALVAAAGLTTVTGVGPLAVASAEPPSSGGPAKAPVQQPVAEETTTSGTTASAAPTRGRSAAAPGKGPGRLQDVAERAQPPAAEKPVKETPASGTPSAGKPAKETPAAGTPAADQPAKEVPASGTPATQQPVEQPAAEQPSADEPGAEQPTETPANDEPAAEKPAAEKPAADKPAADKPAAEKPAPEKPAAEKPVADKPAPEKPAAEKPAAGPVVGPPTGVGVRGPAAPVGPPTGLPATRPAPAPVAEPAPVTQPGRGAATGPRRPRTQVAAPVPPRMGPVVPAQPAAVAVPVVAPAVPQPPRAQAGPSALAAAERRTSEVHAADPTPLRPTGAEPIALPEAPVRPDRSELTVDLAAALPSVAAQTAEAVARTPQLPLGLAGIVVVFLLLQSRIDRRDPKLALAQVEADEPLEFVEPARVRLHVVQAA